VIDRNQDDDIEKYFEGISDEHFTKAVGKHTAKNLKQKDGDIARLKKEASRHLALSDSDKKLKALAELD